MSRGLTLPGYRSFADTSDVVVVGGGTAGLFTAYLLAGNGLCVRLIEASRRLGSPTRTLIITNRLCDVLGFEPSEAIVNRTPELRLVSPHRSSTIRLREPDLIVERAALVQALAARAESAGVEIRTGHRFLGFEEGEAGLTVAVQSPEGRTESLRTRHLVAADGAFSDVARRSGLASFDHVSLLQVEIALPSWAPPETTQVWFSPEATRFFYWLEPRPPSQAVVGLIADGERQAQRALARFLADQRLEPLGYQAAQIPVYRPRARLWREVAGSRVYLVGDAAAQVKMTTVGGIVTGLRGGAALARSIVGGTDYHRELTPLHVELALHLLVHRVISRSTGQDYDAMLGALSAKVQSILGAHTRDEISRILFPSLVAQPRFALIAARCVLHSLLGAGGLAHDEDGMVQPYDARVTGASNGVRVR
ncbi:MAG TPA: NAD(P)/FAD-dependent oxidoreductase [Anaerolineae bacterium]|nr:NAD(P)/FAD-dependent oxidoreductase [Anaerolineae bacterium]HOQ98417.1 NAD(P)/FAD-dependent oxidoreductase [Anaerolineae bacterium]HPL26471.1 NAD(P)/FAD-dependent oxidoreductase [Anaerolineae bacterium]